MSEETIKNEEAKAETPATEKKPWFNRIWSAVTGIVIGLAAMFGVNYYQANEIKKNAETAFTNVQAVIQAIKDKDYAAAMNAAQSAVTNIKTIAGDVKEASATVKESYEQYRESVKAIQAAVKAKDLKTAAATATKLIADITKNIPAESLTGKTKEIFDIAKQIVTDAEAGKYEPVVSLVEKLVKLFEKKADAPAAEPVVSAPAAA